MRRGDPVGSIQAVILGTDAILAVQPAEPIQLARACQEAGFDLVAPVTWGEELLAMRVADVVADRRPVAVVAAHCPFVAEALRAEPPATPCIASVSPPVAAARYLRAALAPLKVEITYVGSCPGASSAEIDRRLLPDVLIGHLMDAGIDVEQQPAHLIGQLPADRSRYASLPGGAPTPRWLAARADALAAEAAPTTAGAVGGMRPGRPVVIDLEVACGCARARDRRAVARTEPPRSDAPVVLPLLLELGDPGLLPRHLLIEAGDAGAAVQPELPAAADRVRERAAFLERGLSAADPFRPPEPLTTLRFSAALEPWSVVIPPSHDRLVSPSQPIMADRAASEGHTPHSPESEPAPLKPG